ncbi:MAG: SapC family protein [Pseudomonadota bacterium]
MTKYIPVSTQSVGLRTWSRYSNYKFADGATLLPALVPELPKLMPHYVLVFATEPDATLGLMVLTGLLPNRNAYLSAQNRWVVPYVPAVLRGYPFKLGTLPGEQKSRALFVDEASGLLAPQGEAEAFFDDAGQPSAALKQVLEFLGDLDAQHDLTQRAVGALHSAGVLEAWPLKLALTDNSLGAVAGSKSTKHVDGLWRVSKKALDALAPDALASLRDQGALAVAYAQLFSMAQLENLVALVQRLAQPTSPKAASVNGLPAATAFQLPQSDTLKFS